MSKSDEFRILGRRPGNEESIRFTYRGVTFDQENSAYLCDARRLDGYFYLLYIGATELATYGGFGHTELGIARSKDLVVWSVPCGPGAVSTPAGCA